MIKDDRENGIDLLEWRDDAPVFEVDFEHVTTYTNGDKLRDIWFTEPFWDEEDGVGGRVYTVLYPYFDDADPDSDVDGSGWDALHFGGCYYDEAMGYTDSDDHDKRIDCWRACRREAVLAGSCGVGGWGA